jgi:hypothetical protein
VPGLSGRRYIWTYHEEPAVQYLVTLNPRDEPATTLLALNSYCRPFLMPESRLGIWAPEIGYLRLLCFDPDRLRAFPLGDVAGWFKKSEERIYSATGPLAELEISSRLAAGKHKIEVPAEFAGLDEVLVASPYPAPSKDDPAFAILIVRPGVGEVEVLPQRWFTNRKYQPGRQWITRVTRDPVSQRLIGDGFRIGAFELEEDGCELARWL